MRKHFGSDPDKFLKGLGIKDGMSGLSFVIAVFNKMKNESGSVTIEATISLSAFMFAIVTKALSELHL